MVKVSCAIPVFNSEKTLRDLVERIKTAIGGMGYEAEIVCVDDRSRDASWKVLKELKSDHKELKIARLARNAGQHSAVLCALTLATGDIVITMDDDLQHPPEEIPKLVRGVEEGAELVIGAYEDDKKHSAFRNFSGGLVDGVLRRIFNLPPETQLTSFRAMSKALRDRVTASYSAYPYITAILLSHSSNYANVLVRHDKRREGSSNYNFTKSAKLAATLIFTYSTYPARFIGVVCALVFLALVGFSGWILYDAFHSPSGVPGWASTIVAVTFLNGLVLIALAVLSFYISRMYLQISGLRSAFSIEQLHE